VVRPRSFVYYSVFMFCDCFARLLRFLFESLTVCFPDRLTVTLSVVEIVYYIVAIVYFICELVRLFV